MKKTRRPLAAATWLICVLGLSSLGAVPMAPEAPAPVSDEERIVRLLLHLSTADAQALNAVVFEVQCADVVSHREPLQRIAKQPRALKAARRILERTFRNDQAPQYLAAAVLAWSGDRSAKTRRFLKLAHASCVEPEVKQRFLELLAPFGVQGAHNALTFGVFTQPADEGPGYVEPLFEYRQGEWEPSLVERMRGPGKWFLYKRPEYDPRKPIRRSGPVATTTETELYTSECANTGWGFKAPKPPKEAWLALSKDIPLQVFTPSPPELREVLERLTARSPGAVLNAVSWGPDQKPRCEPFKAWREEKTSFSRLTMRCTGAGSAGQRLCYVMRDRTFTFGKGKDGGAQCTEWCRSEDWVDVGGENPRVFLSAHYCEAGDYVPGGTAPLASLVLDGRTYVLAAITCYEGCNGFEIHEVTATGLRPVINRGSTAACD